MFRSRYLQVINDVLGLNGFKKCTNPDLWFLASLYLKYSEGFSVGNAYFRKELYVWEKASLGKDKDYSPANMWTAV